MPTRSTPFTNVRAFGKLGTLCALSLFALAAHAQCPDPLQTSTSAPAEVDTPQLSGDFEFEADSMEATRNGSIQLNGEVVIRQGQRSVTTRDATVDPNTQSFDVQSPVEYRDPNLVVRGSGAHVDGAGGARFEGAEFELPALGARGAAGQIQATAAGELRLDDARYTTCPLEREDWVIKASDIDISQSRALGTARNVRLTFKGVPILYTPFFSFPVGSERKSGFLRPSFGGSTRSGTSLAVPWYWNIAPNYDATFTPTWFAKRGAKLDTQFRYLTNTSEGRLEVEYLPEDAEYMSGTERSFIRFIDQSDFTDSLRLDIEAANVSDEQWFEDFGLGPEGTSIVHLDRSANLTYLSDHWRAMLRAQDFQTIDEAIAPDLRPYTVLPQLAVSGEYPDSAFGLTFGLDMEVGNFDHSYEAAADPLPTGWRMDVVPEIRMPLRRPGVFLEPSASWRYTAYQLDDENAPEDSPSRSAPIFSVDGGLIFERNAGSQAQRLITFEPRLMYLYVPYRDQSGLPVFDTALADLNLVQLFRTNRFVGPDRLGDANQLSFGVTSRLIDADSGEEFIAATVGQAYYFDEPRVLLERDSTDDTESSDIVAELDLRAYGNWNINMGVQWDPGETRSEKGDVQVQYRPKHDRVVNLGYRFRRGNLEQVEGSLAWPIGRDWSAYARLVYSLEDEQEIDQLAGFEYRSCCWRLRVVGRRYVSDRTGDVDTSILLQLELNGLSSVGRGADAFLERSIRGYSLRAPEP